MAHLSTEGPRSRREREFRRYAESVLGLHAAAPGRAATSSTDVPLTAFAQLVALRLNAKRVLISLLHKPSQYILAEATPTLSLQRDAEHEEGDAMFFGSTILPRSHDWPDETITSAHTLWTKLESDGEDAALCIPDLVGDPRYANHSHVRQAPFIRSYVGVPLMTPSGYAIGTLAVLDDQTRFQGVTRAEMRFLRDVATSVMSHLELARVQMVHRRGVRMVRGLSRFMEGKDTICNDTKKTDASPTGTSQPHGKLAGGRDSSDRTNALGAGSNAERKVDDEEACSLPHRSQFRCCGSALGASVKGIDEEKTRFSKTSDGVRKSNSKQATASIRWRQPSANELQEDAMPGDIEQAFQRAAKLIQQAMEMAGVLFLDASVGQFGSLTSPQHADESSGSSTESPHVDSTTGTETVKSIETERLAVPNPLKACRYLGAAYQIGEDGSTDSSHQEIPERFLRSLQRRYPHGKIFNYDGEGVISSSDECSDSSEPGNLKRLSRGAHAERTAKRKKLAQSDSAKLLAIFPGVKSFAIMPMYDSQKARHLAGALVWSYDPTRLFTFQDDLNYLGAFCDVLMAEVGRLDLQAEARSKSNFISSISHELRSPLHGILGGVEFLQDDPDDNDPERRSQMVQVIDTCGRSLLDIINNLLEHARTGTSTGRRTSARMRHPRGSATSSDPVHDLAVLTEEVLDSTLWQTPKPAPRRTSGTQLTPTAVNDESLKVILDLDISNLPASGWNFHINAGAFRRILQNITIKAIKYTDNGGFFKLGLKILRGPQRGRMAMVEIECTDSGRGMSPEYLKSGLWQAFHQEDPHAIGTGLGLSLVRTLVEEMNGTIDVKSTKDVGTSIVIKLPLSLGNAPDIGLLDSAEAARVAGLKFALVGFDATEGQVARSSEATAMLRHSVEHMCQYLGMLPFCTVGATISKPGIFIVTERRAIAASALDARSQEAFQSGPCIILCDSVSSSRTTSSLIAKAMSHSQATVMSQPIGPSQLLRAITLCLSKSPTMLRSRKVALRPGIAPIASKIVTQSAVDPAVTANAETDEECCFDSALAYTVRVEVYSVKI